MARAAQRLGPASHRAPLLTRVPPTQVDGVSGKMTAATAVMKKMLKKKDRGKLCAIFVLTIVLIILVYFVFT